MRFVHSGIRTCARVGLCVSALAAGAALGRYTDVARHELRFGASKALAAPLPRPGMTMRESKASKAVAAAAVASAALSVSEDDEERAVRDAPLELAPEQAHDALGHALRNGRIMTGATPHRLILFTFDDGPSRFTTPLLLDRLDAAGVRAIFFLTGSNKRGENVAERKHQEIARETARRGHILASHGYMHQQLPLLDDTRALSELTQTEEIFEKILGKKPALFRPPGGAHSPRIDKLVAQRGYTMVLWNLGAGDFQVRTAAEVHQTWRAVLERREAQGERGGIILLHDTYAWSVEAFQLIVRDLLDRNCELLATDEELYDFVDDPALFFEARGTADASTVARPAKVDPRVIAARQARLRQDTEQRCQTLAAR
jgi:peptidoglycan-N-acetylglucosamine deacetylase